MGQLPPGGPPPVEEAQPPVEEAAGELAGPPPPPRRPDGILPVSELTRFAFAPSDRPRARLLNDALVIVTASGTVEAHGALDAEFRWKLGFPGISFFEPVLVRDRLLLASPSGKLLFVDEVEGKILEEVTLPFELALAPLPGEEPGRFFLATANAVMSYDLAAGQIFRTEVDEQPMALSASHSLLVVSGGERTLTALDARNGSLIWRFVGRGAFHAEAVFREDSKRLFIGDDAGEFYSLSADRGNIDFRWSTGAAIRSPALVEGNRVYVGSFANNLYAYDSGGGSEQWRARLPGRPATKPIRVNQRLLVATLDGILIEVETSRGHLGRSYALPGEVATPPSARIEPPPPIPDTTEQDTESAAMESLEAPTTPQWFELSRISAVLRTGEVVLLRHHVETPAVAPPSTEDSTVLR